jgi:hypothetical protein
LALTIRAHFCGALAARPLDRRAGDFQIAAQTAPEAMVFHNAGSHFVGDRARVEPQKLTPPEIVALLR